MEACSFKKANMVKPRDWETSLRICQNLASLKDDPTYSDVIVIVGAKEFRCHRAILAAVSSFFDTAFKTDMKEARERKITLPSINEDTFSAILASIYGGKYILTEYNLFEVWAAADLLQIGFLCSQCERECEIFLDTKLTVDNCIDVLSKVRLYSDKAKQKALARVCENFKDYRIQVKIYLLETSEMKYVVTNNMLNVSAEDDVVESIIRWGEGQLQIPWPTHSDSKTRERMEDDSFLSILDQFKDLLSSTRYLLISQHCLHQTLAKHLLVTSNPGCQAIVDEILTYQSNSQLHYTWGPPAAIHRRGAKLSNVLVLAAFFYRDDLNTVSFLRVDPDSRTKKWEQLNLPDLRISHYWCDKKIFYHHSKLIFTSFQDIYVLDLHSYKNRWRSVTFSNKEHKHQNPEFSFEDSIINLTGNSLYLYRCGNDSVLQVYKNSNFLLLADMNETLKWNLFFTMNIPNQGEMKLIGVTSFRQTQLVFLSPRDDKTLTIVCIDGLRLTHNIFSLQLDFKPLYGLVTFNNDKEVFLLLNNGFLWKIQMVNEDSLDIKVTYELALWDGFARDFQAILFNCQLVLVGGFFNNDQIRLQKFDPKCHKVDKYHCIELAICLPGVFESVRVIDTDKYDFISNICMSVLPSDFILRQSPRREASSAKHANERAKKRKAV